MFVIILTCIGFFLLCCVLSVRIVYYRWHTIARERKAQALRDTIVTALAELLSQPPPRVLPSSVEYREYITPIVDVMLHLVHGRAYGRKVLSATLLEYMTHVSGEARVRLEHIYTACGFMDEALQKLASPVWWERANAIRELRISRPLDALNPLCDMLMDANSDVVLEALYAVLDTGGVKMIPQIVRILPRMSQLEEMYIVDLCMRTGFECVEHILPLLNDERNDIKRFALHTLGAIHSVEHISVVLPFLGSNKHELVDAALDALGNIASDEATEEIEKLCFRSDPLLQAKATMALRRIGGARSVHILSAMLDDKDSNVRGAASNALAKLRLNQVFDSSSPSERLAYYKTRSFQSRGAL